MTTQQPQQARDATTLTLRPCLDCGVPTTRARCPRHTPAKHGRTWAERKRRRDTVAAHIAQHGNICPGYQRGPHPSDDLTADHLLPRSTHGDKGPLGVLCRSCNAHRGAGGRGRANIETELALAPTQSRTNTSVW